MGGSGEGGILPSTTAIPEEGPPGSSDGAAAPLPVEGNEGRGALPTPPLGWSYKTSKTSGKQFLYHKDTKRTAWTIEEITL